MKRSLVLAVIVGAAACENLDENGTTTGTGIVVTGTLRLSAWSFTAVRGGATCQAGGYAAGLAYATLFASDQPGLCAYLQLGQARANARSLELTVIRVDPSSPTAAVTTGTYPVVTSPGALTAYALVQVRQNDASCSPSDLQASTGSVEVTSVAGGGLMGTIVALVPPDGKITGAFDAPACAVTSPGDACAGSFGPVASACAP
jgi:hypothetical protein